MNCPRCDKEMGPEMPGRMWAYGRRVNWVICDCGFGLAFGENGDQYWRERGIDWKVIPDGCLFVIKEESA